MANANVVIASVDADGKIFSHWALFVANKRNIMTNRTNNYYENVAIIEKTSSSAKCQEVDATTKEQSIVLL